MTADDVAALTESVVRLIREEVSRVALSGRNWKVIVNGSAAGDVRLVVEEHIEVSRRCQQVNS